MLKKASKAAAFACTLALMFSLCGCADTSWAVKTGDITIPSGVYIYNLMRYSEYAEYYVQLYYSSNTSALNNPWSQTLGTTSEGSTITAESWAVSSATNATETYAIIEKLCAEKKVTLTSAEKKTADADAAQAYKNTNYYSLNGVSLTSLERISEDQTLRNRLFDAYYGSGGDQEVSESDLKAYFVKNYVRVQHIVIKTVDDSNNSLSNDEIAAAKAKAKKVYALAQKKGADFSALMKKYSQDVDSSGNVNEPNGYVFSETTANDEGYDSTFISTATSMKVGQVKMASTSYGYDIMLKKELDPDGSYLKENKSSVLEYMKSDDFSTVLSNALSKATVSTNSAAIEKYKPGNLKAATSNAASSAAESTSSAATSSAS